MYVMRSFRMSLIIAVTFLFSSILFPTVAPAQSNQAPSSSSVPAQAKKGANPASADARSATNAAEAKHDYSQEAFVVEQYRTTLRFENDGTGRKETVTRIRVQSEAGVQQWGQIQIGYNSANEKVEIAYVRVVKADGTIVKAGDDAVQDAQHTSRARSSRLHRFPAEAHHGSRPSSRGSARI